MKCKQLAAYLVAGLVFCSFSCEKSKEQRDLLPPKAHLSLEDCLSHSRYLHIGGDSIIVQASTLDGNAIYDFYVSRPNGVDSIWGIRDVEIDFENALPPLENIKIDLKQSTVFSHPTTDGVSVSIGCDSRCLSVRILPSTCSPHSGQGLWFRLIVKGRSHCKVTFPGGITIVIDDDF